MLLRSKAVPHAQHINLGEVGQRDRLSVQRGGLNTNATQQGGARRDDGEEATEGEGENLACAVGEGAEDAVRARGRARQRSVCPRVASADPCVRSEIGNSLPNNRRQRRTCYALSYILYPVSAAHTSIIGMNPSSRSCVRSHNPSNPSTQPATHPPTHPLKHKDRGCSGSRYRPVRSRYAPAVSNLGLRFGD